MKKYEFTKEKRSFIEGMRQPFAVCQFLETGVVTLVVSDGFCEMFGYEDRAQAYSDMNQNMFKDIHPDDTARFTNALLSFGAGGSSLDVLYRAKKKDASGYKVIHLNGEHVYTEDGLRLAQIWFTDEGAYKEENGDDLRCGIAIELREENIRNAVRYDLLTGLPNLNGFFELAEVGRKTILDQGGLPALLYMDLSGMKSYNHKYGFSEGDKLLRHFAGLLSRTFRTERCCHIGADRFSAVVDENELKEKLNSLFQEWREMKNHMHLPICVGIYPYRIEAVPAGLAYDRAKIACDAIRNAYSSSFNYYSDDLSDGIVKQNYILENFERALSENWVQVYYQPIVRAINGKVCDEEALARWIDPVRGFLPPSEFIPYLEDAGLIYKLDLYVVERVLEHMKVKEAEGFYIVPHSINLSRSDFDACDMVEEIMRRVDAAGVSRDRISIEITESVIGSDFDYMKVQIERFRAQGFQVWMDDFGSGYSSLDVLQSVKFDLIKFDMGFMRRLDEGDNGKIILTEMMKMATSLGVDTVCEGVETEEQVRFLQEIGCSKLQGYYFMKPSPPEQIIEKYAVRIQDGIEDPGESSYYDTVGRVNLYDLSFLANKDDSVIRNTFDTVPMGIMEVNSEGDTVRYVRTNQSFRDFMKRAFKLELSDPDQEYSVLKDGHGSDIMKAIAQCRNNENRVFIDEELEDGSIVHSFLRRIVRNPVNGKDSFAFAVLSITEPDEKTMTYADIARALAADYYNIFVIDLDTDEYIEYASQVGGEEMLEKRRGADFFGSAKKEALTRIYEEDREPFLTLFSKERVLQDLDSQGVFTTTYRLIDMETPMYVNMKITRMHGGNRIILGISVIDAQMKQQEEAKKLQSEKISLGRIAALSPDYIVLYMVDPVTGQYTQFNPSNEYESVGLARQGVDFFADVVADSPKALAPEDLERHLRVLTRENMLSVIQKDGFLIHNYRMMLDGKRIPVKLRATLIQENESEKIILGITNDGE